MRTIKLTSKELVKLLNNKELFLQLASRTLHVEEDNNIILNYEGIGYSLKGIELTFEQDDSINFSEEL